MTIATLNIKFNNTEFQPFIHGVDSPCHSARFELQVVKQTSDVLCDMSGKNAMVLALKKENKSVSVGCQSAVEVCPLFQSMHSCLSMCHADVTIEAHYL